MLDMHHHHHHHPPQAASIDGHHVEMRAGLALQAAYGTHPHLLLPLGILPPTHDAPGGGLLLPLMQGGTALEHFLR